MQEGPAKGRQRAYDARGRQERARRQYEATLEHARERFLALGYAATTVESIARAAGVSEATVYKTYGGKAAIVRQISARALTGDGPLSAEARSDALRASDDPHAVIDGWGALAAEVSPRISPIVLLLRAAAEIDGEAAALYTELEEARLVRMAENARFLADHGHLRASVTVDEARDVLWLCSSADLYDVLVARRGWSTERFGAFVAQTIAAAVL